MLSVLVVLLSLLSIAYGRAPYCSPRNATCWPSSDEWSKLNTQLTGSLRSLQTSDYKSCRAQGDDAFKISESGEGVCMQYHDCSKGGKPCFYF